MIKKAFILGAGLGTRLRPLTFIRPKPLIPVFGKPLLEHAIGHLKSIGINHIIVNTHHLPLEYERIIGKGEKYNLNISYSYEPKLLDTGGGLKNIESFIGNETFIMYNGDILTNIDLNKMMRFHKEKKAFATLLVSKRQRPLHVQMDKDHKILDFGPKGAAYAFCGIHILEPEIFQYIPPSKPISIITIYKKLINKGLPIIGYRLGNASWQEIGSINSYKKIVKVKRIEKELTPSGSQRKFSRIEIDGDSIIAMRYDPKKEENNYYVNTLLFLKKTGINVPGLIDKDSTPDKVYLEDLGNKTLSTTPLIGLYKKALDQISKLHLNGKELYEKKPFPISQPFSYKLYRWESNYFEENCLASYFKKNANTELYKDFDFLAKRLSKPSSPMDIGGLGQCLIHRDFQSKNIMVKNNDVYLIDFQGMRFGLPHYDLASLLYDPYVNLPQKMRNNLYNYYVGITKRKDDFIEIYKYTAVQRLMQALGAYGYLGLKLGKKEFLSFIPQAINNLRIVLEEIDGLDGLKELIIRLNLLI